MITGAVVGEGISEGEEEREGQGESCRGWKEGRARGGVCVSVVFSADEVQVKMCVVLVFCVGFDVL